LYQSDFDTETTSLLKYQNINDCLNLSGAIMYPSQNTSFFF